MKLNDGNTARLGIGSYTYPSEAARDFLLGHVFCELGILFEKAGFPFSDGAKKAIAEAKKDLFQPDWKKVFDPEALRRSVAKITGQVPG